MIWNKIIKAILFWFSDWCFLENRITRWLNLKTISFLHVPSSRPYLKPRSHLLNCLCILLICLIIALYMTLPITIPPCGCFRRKQRKVLYRTTFVVITRYQPPSQNRGPFWLEATTTFHHSVECSSRKRPPHLNHKKFIVLFCGLPILFYSTFEILKESHLVKRQFHRKSAIRKYSRIVLLEKHVGWAEWELAPSTVRLGASF